MNSTSRVHFSLPAITFTFNLDEEKENENENNWMQLAADRERFQRRIKRMEEILEPIFLGTPQAPVVIEKRSLIVDIQGFDIPEFAPKEVALTYDGYHIWNYIVKPVIPFHMLNVDAKRSVRWLERNHHCIRYSDGMSNLDELKDAFKKLPADIVYVKGSQKCKYLQQFYSNVIDLSEDFYAPNLEKTENACNNHLSKPCVCAYSNVVTLYNYIIKAY